MSDMLKSTKVKVLLIIIVILCLSIYIITDCIKLRRASFGTRPIITLWEEGADTTPTYNEYVGLGYTIKYTWNMKEESVRDTLVSTGHQSEFRLFGVFPIWTE